MQVRVEEVGPRHQDAISTVQRHTSMRHALSISVALLLGAGAIGAAAFGILSPELATLLGIIVAAVFGLRAVEVLKAKGE